MIPIIVCSVKNSEEKSKKAVADASRLAEELRTEQVFLLTNRLKTCRRTWNRTGYLQLTITVYGTCRKARNRTGFFNQQTINFQKNPEQNKLFSS